MPNGSLTSLNCFGDSITVGFAASPMSLDWCTLLAAHYGASQNNQGISSTVLQNSNGSGGVPLSSNGRSRFVSALLGGNKSSMVAILYGFNDARYTATPSSFSTANYIADYESILNGLFQGGYTQYQIVIGDMPYINTAGLAVGCSDFCGTTQAVFTAYRAAAAQVAQEYGVYFAGVGAAMTSGGGDTLISGDNLHPNNAGHAVIEGAFLAAQTTNPYLPLTSLSASNSGSGQVTVTFSAVAGATAYDVQIGSNGTYIYPTTAQPTSSPNVFSGLTSGVYNVRVRPRFTGGNAPWSFVNVTVS